MVEHSAVNRVVIGSSPIRGEMGSGDRAHFCYMGFAGQSMEFVCTDELKEYMTHKKLRNIIVEVVTSDYSEFEITELHVHLINDERADYFVNKKNYKINETDFGRVLLPGFKLEYEDRIFFGLKKHWIFKSISYSGVRHRMV